MTFANQENNERALEDYSRAIALNPEEPTAYFYRGRIYADLDNPEQAIANFDQAIALQPTYAQAFHHRGVARAASQQISPFRYSVSMSPVPRCRLCHEEPAVRA